jgi:AGZA family xanthine/uracil permease-like MFS transporter
MLNKAREYFLLDERKSSIRVEVIAGVSTFLSLAYIFIVNPAILHEAGPSVPI